MSDILLVYVTCEGVTQAESIAQRCMELKLCACANIFPDMQPIFFWPPKSGKIDKTKEVVLILKTVKDKWNALKDEVAKIHSYDVPCILAIPVSEVNEKYYQWLKGELE